MSEESVREGMSRRRFITATTAATAVMASGLPLGKAWAAPAGTAGTAGKAARYRRMNLADPNLPPRILTSYKTAVSRMLSQPPQSPYNWYRNAIVHTLDCPHGNWWFLPWHRGYTGWFERVCRYISQDAEFALPYWDWTAEPKLPPAYFDMLLNPTKPPFIPTWDEFRTKFSAALTAYWNELTPAQHVQLDKREIDSLDTLWSMMQTYFFPLDVARRPSLTPATPDLLEPARSAVVIQVINDALAAGDFIGFGSDKAAYHSEMVGFAVLEANPHNLVHNDFEGFMQDFLSPVDPIFFMHHANIDRLWDVWTRKQIEQGGPILPEGGDLAPWSDEPFLFFVAPPDEGTPGTRAGDYAAIGAFDYDYQPGSGDAVLGKAKAAGGGQSFAATLDTKALAFTGPATGTVKVPAALLEAASGESGPTLVARVAVHPQAGVRGTRYHVLVNAPKGAASLSLESPSYVGALEFFGTPHHVMGPVNFTIPLTKALKALRKTGQLKMDEPLQIHVVADTRGVQLKAFDSSLDAVAVRSY